jgi:hypothetical protein
MHIKAHKRQMYKEQQRKKEALMYILMLYMYSPGARKREAMLPDRVWCNAELYVSYVNV